LHFDLETLELAIHSVLGRGYRYEIKKNSFLFDKRRIKNLKGRDIKKKKEISKEMREKKSPAQKKARAGTLLLSPTTSTGPFLPPLPPSAAHQPLPSARCLPFPPRGPPPPPPL
jgi:hypothetical protein